MPQLKKSLCVLLLALLLARPVLAEAEMTQPTQPDIVTAVKTMALLPGSFSPLSPKTAEKQWFWDMTTAPLYAMEADGTWVGVLAAALPEDVTAEYAGTYGIPAAARRNLAYRIALNPAACWEDGTPITADDYLFSIRQLLQNGDASENWLFLANASAILSQNQKPGTEIVSLRQAGFADLGAAWAAGFREFYVDTEGFWGLGAGWRSISDRTRIQDYAMPGGLDEGFVTPAYLYNRYLINGAESSHEQGTFLGVCSVPGETLTLEDLGLIKTGDLELVLILQQPAAPSALMQKLESLFLLRRDASGQTAEKYCSYGPYRITDASINEIILEPNPNWWGDPDPRGYDRILCQKIGT